MHRSLCSKLARICFAALSIAIFGTASANVPIDSFNSANAALNPALAVKRDAAEPAAHRGPAAALARFARQKSRPAAATVAQPAAPVPTPENP